MRPGCGPGLSRPLAVVSALQGRGWTAGVWGFLCTHTVRRQVCREGRSLASPPASASVPLGGVPSGPADHPARRGPSVPRWFKMWELPPLLLQQLGFRTSNGVTCASALWPCSLPYGASCGCPLQGRRAH